MLPKIARILPLQKTNAVIAGDIVSFRFPDGVLDLSTVRLWFNASITGGNANFVSMPVLGMWRH